MAEVLVTHLFSFCLLLSWIKSTTLHAADNDFQYSENLSPSAWTPAHIGATVVYVAVLEAWTFDVHRGITGLVLLGMMAAIRQYERSKWPPEVVVPLGKYVPAAACLLGYTVVWWIGEATGIDKAHAWDAACGVIGGAWTWAGISKIQQGGNTWFHAGGLSLLVAERAYVTREPLSTIRLTFIQSPTMSALLSGYALILECLGFLFCVPALRLFIAAQTTALLLGIMLFLGYIEFEWTLVMVALALITWGGVA